MLITILGSRPWGGGSTTPPGGGGGSGTPDLSQLPAANRLVPDYAWYEANTVRSLSAGQSYTDPVSGVTVWRATDRSSLGGNTRVVHSYAETGPMISQRLPNGRYRLLLNKNASGVTHMIDFERGVGFTNARAASVTLGADTCQAFSTKAGEEHILYYLSGESIKRFDTDTNADAASGIFPVDLSSLSGSGSVVQLSVDHDFAWMTCQQGSYAYGVKLSDGSKIEYTNTPFDEVRLAKTGGYAAYIRSDETWVLWNLNANTQNTSPSGVYGSHRGGIRGGFIGKNPNDGSYPRWRFEAATNTQTTYGTQPNSGASGDGHPAGHWIQPAASFSTQYCLFSGYGDGAQTEGTWTNHSGNIWYCTPSTSYGGGTIGVRSVVEHDFSVTNIVRGKRQLTSVGSIGAMSAGTFYWDSGTGRCYVWRSDSKALTASDGKCRVFTVGLMHQGIYFERVDGADFRLLCHDYTMLTGYFGGDYWSLPKATISPDGLVVMFTSNMNNQSTTGTDVLDVWVAEVPEGS